MKFTLNGLEVTCTPAEFNELRGLGTITAECPSVSTQSVADACKDAGIPLEKTECNIDWSKVAIWPPRNEGPGTKFPPVPKGSEGKGVTLDKIAPDPDAPKPVDIKKELKDTLPDSPDKDDIIALKQYLPPTKYGYVFVYAVADRDKSRVCEYYHGYNNAFTTDLAQAVHYSNPDLAFDYVAAHPDKNLCVVRVKVPVSE